MMGPWGTVKPLWFGGGRIDAFAPEEDVNWGHEPEWLKDDRHNHDTETGLDEPLGAVQMGLIYVNPVSYPSTMRLLFSSGVFVIIDNLVSIDIGRTWGQSRYSSFGEGHSRDFFTYG